MFSRLICAAVICFFAVSCSEKHNPETLLHDTMTEINSKDSGYDDFKVYSSPTYYAIFYQLQNTPENKAKILWLANHEDLGQKFRGELLKRLKEGDILARVVKEGKSLILGVAADQIEYRVVVPPAEIIKTVFKQ